MRRARLAVVVGIAVIVQSALAPLLTPIQMMPQLPLLVVVFVCIYASPVTALVTAFTAGLLLDLVSIERLGAHALVLVGIAWALLALRESIFQKHLLTQVMVAFFATLIAMGGHLVLLAATFRVIPRDAPSRLVLGAAATAIVTGPVFRLLRRTGLAASTAH